MLALRQIPLQAARDLLHANAQLQAEEAYLRQARSGDVEEIPPATNNQSQLQMMARYRNSNYFTRLRQLFQNDRTRRATIASACAMIGQQLCGM